MMKRIFALAIFLLLNCSYHAQVIQSIGIKGGGSTANQTWSYKSINSSFKKNSIRGSYAALTLDFISSKYFNLTTDLAYSQKGCSDKIERLTENNPENTGVYDTYTTIFNYLAVSPLFKAKYPTKHLIPYVLLGPRVDYQLSYQSDFNLTQIETNFHKTIWGLSAGAGLEFKLKNIGITSEFQYLYDLTHVMDTDPTINSTGLRIHNRAYILSLGLKYYFHKKGTTE